MRVLITGAGGFVGQHLIRELLRNGHEVIAFDLEFAGNPSCPFKTVTGDIQDAETVHHLVSSACPDACIHLSAISFIPDGWMHIENMFSVNLTGTLHLLEGFRKAAPEARILVVSSVEVYGRAMTTHLIREDDPLNPDNLYAISKAAADRTTLLYASHYGMNTITARPCNHIGPGQSSRFVVASFAEQLTAIALGKAQPILRVGNLDSKRDFIDVRDVARAYRLLIEKGEVGQAYNIASGQAITIRTILDQLCAIAGIHPDIEVDQHLFRPQESHPLLDTTRIETDVHWEPQIQLADTLRDIMSYNRDK